MIGSINLTLLVMME